MRSCVLRVCDPLSCVLRRVGIELLIYLYMLCFVSTGLIYKAFCLGLVHFIGETLSVSFQKFCSTNGSDPMGVRGFKKQKSLMVHYFIC